MVGLWTGFGVDAVDGEGAAGAVEPQEAGGFGWFRIREGRERRDRTGVFAGRIGLEINAPGTFAAVQDDGVARRRKFEGLGGERGGGDTGGIEGGSTGAGGGVNENEFALVVREVVAIPEGVFAEPDGFDAGAVDFGRGFGGEERKECEAGEEEKRANHGGAGGANSQGEFTAGARINPAAGFRLRRTDNSGGLGA